MIKFLVTTFSVMCLATAHEIHTGQCPGFTPMAGFNWEKVSIASLVRQQADGGFLYCFIARVHKTTPETYSSTFFDYSFPPEFGT